MNALTDVRASGRARARLTVAECREAKPRAKPYALGDGAGLRLLVHPNGSRYWQFRYSLADKEHTHQLGSFPSMTLAAARATADAARATVATGRHPKVARDLARAERIAQDRETFETVAADWLKQFRADWSDAHYERNEGMLRRILLPKLADLPIREVSAAALLDVLRASYESTPQSARKARTIADQVFAFAIDTHRAEHNPGAQLRGNKTLRKPIERHHAALRRDQVGPFLRALAKAERTGQVKAALRLMLWTGLRDHSLRGAQWSEIDLEAALWTVPASRMKATVRQREEQEAEHTHRVPLPTQAVDELRRLALLTDAGPDSFVFASRTKAGYLSENTLTKTLRALGFDVTAHGMRSLITDALNEAGFNPDAIERQLAHKERNVVRAAYLRTRFDEQRAPMMQWWADWCEAQQNERAAPVLPGNVTALRAVA